MQHFDPLIDFSLIQRKPGAGTLPAFKGYDIGVWEGDVLHAKGKMFCYNPKCSCHENQLFIKCVARYVREGLLTLQEATNLVAGKHI